MMLSRASRRRLFGMARTLAILGALLSLALSSTVPAFAAGGSNGNVHGSLIDGTTKLPIAGAKVAIASPSGTYTSTTDANGRFGANGLAVDTYVLTIEAKGYDTYSQSGLTIQGDQTIDLGTIVISKLKTIVSVKSRNSGGAYQPGQTTDQYTVGAARQQEVLGKADSTNENALLLSVPGTSTTDSGRVTIRGGLSNEVGFQLDGVPFTEPFFSTNASGNNLNGLGSLQVVEGAGDATQGNVGSGVVNVIPKRGTYPGSGTLDLEVGGPNFSHQFGFDYGIATRSGNISNYFSYIGNRYVPYIGYYNSNVTNVGEGGYFGDTRATNDDLLDNFIFKFGKDNRQSIGVLYDTRDSQGFGEVGGLAGRIPYLYDPYVQNNGGFGFNPFLAVSPPALATTQFEQLTGLTPYTNPNNTAQATQPQIVDWNPTHLLKFEYDNNIDDNTFLQARYYNFDAQNGSNSTYDSSTNPGVSITGGQRVGTNLELTHTVGRHTLTLQAQLENQKPQWNDYAPLETEDVLLIGQGGVSLGDFLPGGYVYSALGPMRLPVMGINYNGADFQTEGIGLRDQWNPTDAIKLDYGVRIDHANYKYGPNPYNPDLGNPSDVDPSFIRNDVLHPNVVEPRIALSIQASKNDSIRASYGRSVEFLNAQDAGTPGGMYGANALAGLAPLPGTNTSNPATWTCGSGLNSARLLPSGANASGKGGGYFQCTNYAQQLFWSYDQNFDAPDVGNGTSPTYNNYDLSYQHQFKNGFGFKATGFYRLSTGLPGFFVLAQKTDPVTGAILYQVFSVNNDSISRTTGAEIEITTPERPVGFSGYFSATYQNAISSIPPLLPGEDELPLVTTESFLLNDTYRAGFLSPFVANFGGTYRFKNGFRITPNVSFNAGYPTGVGNLVAYNGLINGLPYNVPQTNLGGAQPTVDGFEGVTGSATATNYVDPAYAGSILNPNIAASRGEKETSAAGGELTKPYFTANLTAEYTFGKRNTIGLQINNITGQIYAGSTPTVNTYYQPVTTGVAGPQTGYVYQANPAQLSTYGNHGFANIPNSSYGQNAFLLLPNVPTTYRVYYQLSL
jgi:outer membrane receptor protein involved in Fe transport